MASMKRNEDWQSHTWSKTTVDNFHTQSSQNIQLRSNEDTLHPINKGLLCYYSRYYKAALNGRFSEAHQETFDVDLSPKQLNLFTTWLHTGNLELLAWEREDRLMLYVFADTADILALRRQIMTEAGRMERYRQVGLAFSLLPHTSPYCKRMVDFYVNHWEPRHDRYDSFAAMDPTSYGDFFYLVMHGQALQKGIKNRACPCCGNVCDYHEHESEEEWQATCGQLAKCKKPERYSS